jgi:hypothetical protein
MTTLLCPSRVAAQLPRITTEELTLAAPRVEASADAEALVYDMRVEDRWEGGNLIASQEHSIRLKLFTSRGVEAFKTIDLVYPASATLGRVSAKTVLPDGQQIQVPSQAFYGQVLFRDKGTTWYRKSFSPPQLTVGCIVEYSYWFYGYDETSDYMPIEVQKNFPIERLELHVKPLTFPGLDLQMMSIAFNMAPVSFIDEGQDQFHATVTNIGAFHPEPLMPPEDQLRGWLLVYYTEPPELSAYDYWRKFSQRNYSSFRGASSPNGVIRSALGGAESGGVDGDQLRRIFDWCQTRIGNLATDTTRTRSERAKTEVSELPEETLRRGYGRPWEVALLFASLARAAGYEVRPAFINSRRTSPLSPSLGQAYFLDARGVAVARDRTWKLLFPGIPGVAFGDIPEGLEGRTALIADPDSAIWTTTPVSRPEATERISTARLRLGTSGELEGDLRISLTGQLARRRMLDDQTKSLSERIEAWYRELHDETGDVDLTEGQVEASQVGAPRYIFRCRVHSADYAQSNGGHLTMQSNFFRRHAQAQFTSSLRRWSIALPFSWSEVDTVLIEVPQHASNLQSPADRQIDLESWGAFKRLDSSSSGTLLCVRELVVGANGTLDFPRTFYSTLKEKLEDVRDADIAETRLDISPP